jgi:hypothetical protein
MQRVTVILVTTLLTYSLSYCDNIFSWANDLKDKAQGLPVIVPNPNGGYTAIWEEMGDRPEELLGFLTRYYFYRVVDAEGKAIVSRREFDFWRTSPYPTYFAVSFNSKRLLWLDSDRLLILAWKCFNHSGRTERAIINSKGQLVEGPKPAMEEGVSSHAVLMKDSKGGVHAFDHRARLWAMTVYPEFSEARKMTRQEWKEFYDKYPSDVFTFRRHLPCMTTSEDKLLICSRLGWGKTPRSERGSWGFFGRPDKGFYALADLNGNLVSGPVVFDLVEYAFRKMPGIYLGGNYLSSFNNKNIDKSEAADNDMDLSQLPNGDIILSVTGEDETGKLCVYQIKFTPEGEIEKSQRMEVVNPRPFPEDKILPTSKVGWAEGVETYVVQFGFDEEGNFYAYREKWNGDDTNN